MQRFTDTNLNDALPGISPVDMVDRLLDRDVPPDQLAEPEAHIAGDPRASARLESIRRVLDELRAPVATPDLTDRIITEVGQRRRWLAPAWQRVVTSSRLALAATFLAACAVVLVVQRVEPDARIFAQQGTPLTNVVRSSTADASSGLLSIGNMLADLPTLESPAVPVRQNGTTRYVRLDQPMQIFSIRIGQQPRVARFDFDAAGGQVMQIEIRSKTCSWTVGVDADDAQPDDRWSLLSSNNR